MYMHARESREWETGMSRSVVVGLLGLAALVGWGIGWWTRPAPAPVPLVLEPGAAATPARDVAPVGGVGEPGVVPTAPPPVGTRATPPGPAARVLVTLDDLDRSWQRSYRVVTRDAAGREQMSEAMAGEMTDWAITMMGPAGVVMDYGDTPEELRSLRGEALSHYVQAQADLMSYQRTGDERVLQRSVQTRQYARVVYATIQRWAAAPGAAGGVPGPAGGYPGGPGRLGDPGAVR